MWGVIWCILLEFPIKTMINSATITVSRIFHIISVKRMHWIPPVGDMVMSTIKELQQELRWKVHPAVVI